MTYINITKFVLINWLAKDHRMIKTCCLENVVIFIETISTSDLVKMATVVLKKIYFEFNGEVKHQISGTDNGAKFASTYASIFIKKIETNFLDTQEFKPLVWLQYIDDVFLILTDHKEKLEEFLKDFNNYHRLLNLPMTSRKKVFSFWTLRWMSVDHRPDLHIRSTGKHQYLHYASAHPGHSKRSIAFGQVWGLAG